VWEDGGKTVLVVPGMASLTGYDAATGKELWAVDKLPAVACTTPVRYKDALLYVGWSPGGADFKLPTFDEILREAGEEKLGHLTKAGAAKTMFGNFFDNNDPNKDGKITREEWAENLKVLASGRNRAVALKPGGKAEVAWAYTKNLPYVPTAVVYRDRVYWVKDGPQMTCLDAATGKPVYEAERVKAGPRYYASPVAANGHLYLASLDGTVAVVAAGEDAPDVVHAAKLGEPVRATPAIAHDTLYVRTDKFLYAFRK
jgi:outer membrane protein assembly factor BamB